jgi:hypothetical protein
MDITRIQCSSYPDLQTHCTANLKQIFPENQTAWPRSQNHIHVTVSDLYNRSAYFAAKYVHRSWEYINRSQVHECGNCERGGAVSFLDKSDLVCSVYIGELQSSVKFKFGVDFGLKDFRNSFYHGPR